MKKSSKNNKGASMLVEILIATLIILTFAILYTMFSTGGLKKTTGTFNTLTSGTGDPDQDMIANIEDKCPCIAGDYNGKNKGCPADKIPENDKQECLKPIPSTSPKT
jgi:hypothetical protein